jgi:hypothetical protein
MPFIARDGSVKSHRSVFSFSFIYDFFATILSGIGLFFTTLFNPTLKVDQVHVRRAPRIGRAANNGGGGSGGGGARPRFGARMGNLPACSTSS